MRKSNVNISLDFESIMEAGSFMLAILSAHPNAAVRLDSFESSDESVPTGIDVTPVTTGAEDVPPAPEDSTAGTEPAPAPVEGPALNLLEQKQAKELFNKFTRKHGIADGAALLAKYEARRWSDLTPIQMGMIAAELSVQ